MASLVKRQQTTRIVCISDTHSRQDFQLPHGDILIHAGDFSGSGRQHEVQQFLNYLASLKQYRLKIFIAGNHDVTLEPDFYLRCWPWHHQPQKENYEYIRLLVSDPALTANYGIVYLENEKFTDRETGLKFYGSPYQPGSPNWAFRLPPGSPQIKQVWSRIPNDVDVLITHGPPANILDETFRGEHVGCVHLYNKVKQIKPLLHVFGHIHEAHGEITHPPTTFINASICNHQYQPIQPPIVCKIKTNSVK